MVLYLEESTDCGSKKEMRETIEELQADYQTLQERYSGVVAEKATLAAEVERLSFQVKALQQKIFGKSSERRVESSDKQESLFCLPEGEAKPEKKITVKEYSRVVRSQAKQEEDVPEGTYPDHLERRDEVLEEKPEGVAD